MSYDKATFGTIIHFSLKSIEGVEAETKQPVNRY